MSHHYEVMLEADDGGFSVWVPALPGCLSQGDSREEALANVQEAIQAYLESCLKHGEELPREEDLIRLL